MAEVICATHGVHECPICRANMIPFNVNAADRGPAPEPIATGYWCPDGFFIETLEIMDSGDITKSTGLCAACGHPTNEHVAVNVVPA